MNPKPLLILKTFLEDSLVHRLDGNGLKTYLRYVALLTDNFVKKIS